MKVYIEKSVAVITPTIGTDRLKKAVESVISQKYKNIKHFVVVDGKQYYNQNVEDISAHSNVIAVTLPYNTGKNGYNGQKIYASFPHLLEQDYVMFLDEDNTWDDNHVRSLVELIESENLDWAHSLRKVYIEDQYFADDSCESIGKYPIWFTTQNNPQYLVDTSSYCFRKPFITRTCHLWHSGVWGEDRRYFSAIKDISKYNTTGLYTLNYKLPNMNKAYGGDMQFFEKGNEFVKNFYGGEYPWKKI